MIGVMQPDQELAALAMEAWRQFGTYADPFLVSPSIPILFFRRPESLQRVKVEGCQRRPQSFQRGVSLRSPVQKVSQLR